MVSSGCDYRSKRFASLSFLKGNERLQDSYAHGNKRFPWKTLQTRRKIFRNEGKEVMLVFIGFFLLSMASWYFEGDTF